MRPIGRRWRSASLLAGLLAGALALTATAQAAMPATSHNFLAMGTHTPAVVSGVPPTPSIAVGPTRIVQVVNGGIEIWDKSGTLLQGAKLTNGLWSGYVGTNAGNQCATHNDGDAMVRYDRMADRWIVTQFSIPNSSTNGGPSFECIAVSQTGDPAGAYYLYDFRYAAAINDAPNIGVWSDAYYATFNLFDTAFLGPEVCAWDRAAMLAGLPASQVCFKPGPSFSGLLPANLDGSLAPPSGSPEYLAAEGVDALGTTNSTLDVWKFHVDFATPGNSSLSGPTVLSTAPFTEACATAGGCIPQPGSGQMLSSPPNRLMDTLAYRNFGDHGSLVLNHSITASAGTGVRWYELRVANQVPSISQQGDYAPGDTNWRWLGGIEQDQAGDMALGFSESSAGSPGVAHPSIAWAGRLAADPPGTMGQGEAVIDTGTANEAGSSRWGDHSSMTIDPSDDCTFWYSNEVYNTQGSSTWDTYIASFKFPSCGQSDFSIGAGPGSVSAPQGGGGASAISTAVTRGSAETIALSASGLPAGATASFAPANITAGGSSTLTLTAGASTPAGTYTISIGGVAPSTSHGTTLSFMVIADRPPACTDLPSLATPYNTALAVPLACSDPDVPDAISYSIVTPPQHGVLGAIDASGHVTYGAAAGYAGPDSFTYKATDSHGIGSNTATVNVAVGRAAAPSCTSASVAVAHNGSRRITLPCSHVAADGVRYAIVSGPAHGRLGPISAAGQVTYKPAHGYSGADGLTFKATDTTAGTSSNVARLSITVAPACAGLKGEKFADCKAVQVRDAALVRCARLHGKHKRASCVKAAKLAYRRAVARR